MKGLGARDIASLITVFGFLLVGTGSGDDSARSNSASSEHSSASSHSEQLAITLSDGSSVTFTNVRDLPDWACGTRKGALFNGGDVVLYFDRSGDLFSANIPSAGNQKFYERDPSRSCVKNWVTGEFDILTDREYKRYERQARRKSR